MRSVARACQGARPGSHLLDTLAVRTSTQVSPLRGLGHRGAMLPSLGCTPASPTRHGTSSSSSLRSSCSPSAERSPAPPGGAPTTRSLRARHAGAGGLGYRAPVGRPTEFVSSLSLLVERGSASPYETFQPTHVGAMRNVASLRLTTAPLFSARSARTVSRCGGDLSRSPSAGFLDQTRATQVSRLLEGDHAANAVLGFHQLEAVIDLVKRDPMREE